MLASRASDGRTLSAHDVRGTTADAFARLDLDGQRVLVVIPDGTRTMPMPLMFATLQELAAERTAALDFLVALGTHQSMSDAQLSRHVGQPVVDGRAGRSRILNHRWEDRSTFVTIGTIPAAEIRALTAGRFARPVAVSLNRTIFEYDHLVICGPVFPHEVAGFSGGTKYLFPGIAGPDIIDFTHWLGAVITSVEVIGTMNTPVRAVIDRAARFVDRPTTCISLVVTREGVEGLFIGELDEAWRAAAMLSARRHVVYLDAPVRRVISVVPPMYDDLWTAAKGMYKLEPVVADGGELIIYGPHITEVSHTHGAVLDEIGYHCRDYFLAQWERFGGRAGCVLAHSTHLKGAGRYDAGTGEEQPRIAVTLATGISRERCERVNLGYRDPATVRFAEGGLDGEGDVLVVHRAGEVLYRLRDPLAGAIG
ncbi:MAG TPA: lactate racemase domain-containing protein [Vicinamibacterales bacterium]|nr:lactate racemase domain-containing protein [Vicinamibacterales bacterium]